MLPKLVATWLVVLVIAPLAAPFSPADATSLHGKTRVRHAPVAPRSAVVSTAAAVLTARFIPGGRVRFVRLGATPLARTTELSSSASVTSSSAPSHCIRQQTIRRTILRV